MPEISTRNVGPRKYLHETEDGKKFLIEKTDRGWVWSGEGKSSMPKPNLRAAKADLAMELSLPPDTVRGEQVISE